MYTNDKASLSYGHKVLLEFVQAGKTNKICELGWDFKAVKIIMIFLSLSS